MFTRSEKINEEYCAQVVKIGELTPIENSDKLLKTIVNGYQIVVGKDDVKEGQIMIYAKLETAVNKDFLSVNNQFEIGERQLNKNYEEVQKLIDEGKNDEAKTMVGYFNKHGRVRIVKLRGCPSEGCLFTIDSVAKWKPQVLNYDFNKCFEPDEDGIVKPFNFDTIDGDLFCKVYVPYIPTPSQRGDRNSKRNRKLARFNRMIEGQFSFHYTTSKLNENIWKFKSDTVVDISVKLHGTSIVIGNLLVKKPKSTTMPRKLDNKRIKRKLRMAKRMEERFYWQRMYKRAKCVKLQERLDSQYTVGYGNITSSRTVIKNQYINTGEQNHFYGKDVWSDYGKLMYPYLLEGMTLYGEICGYVDGTTSMIQKGYDYGCSAGESFLMPYRITYTDPDGKHTEWEVSEVYGWTVKLLADHPELKDKVHPINILYHGTLGELYPDLDTAEHWNENVLLAMADDKEHFGMELNEPLCKNKVPREGIVLRITEDPHSEAFKLKTFAFLLKEAKMVDSGDVDIEMENNMVNA